MKNWTSDILSTGQLQFTSIKEKLAFLCNHLNWICFPLILGSWKDHVASVHHLKLPNLWTGYFSLFSSLEKPNKNFFFSLAPARMPSVQFSSVTQACPTVCDPMNRSTPGLPVYHHLPEFTQTHVHRVGDAIQPSHPLLSPFPPAPNPSQHQSLFQWVNSWSLFKYRN